MENTRKQKRGPVSDVCAEISYDLICLQSSLRKPGMLFENAADFSNT